MTRRASIALSTLLLVQGSLADAQPPAGALGAVLALYRAYAWEAVSDDAELSIPDVAGQPRATLVRYFDEAMVSLIMKDRACSARTGELCNLDFSPIWDSQDPVGTTVRMSQGKDDATVVVKLRLPGGETRQLTYAMVKTAAGWRIHDIAYDSHASLASMLRGKP